MDLFHKMIGGLALGALLALGAAASPARAQSADIDPVAVDYGEVDVGDTAFTQIRVTNNSFQTIVIQSVTQGGSPAFFFQQPGSFPIGPGQFWILQVAFRPPRAGTFNGSVRIRILNGGQTRVPLTGVGVQDQARINVTPLALGFGLVQLGREASRTLRISNQGNAQLNVQGITTSSAAFESADPGGFVLQPGGSRTVAVTFRPVVANPVNAVLSVSSDDPSRPNVQVALSGAGEVPAIDFSATIVPGRLRVSPGGTVPVTIRLRNLGDERLEIRSLGAEVLMPDGSSLALSDLRTTPAVLTAGATMALPSAVLLPEAFYEALGGGSGEARFVQTLVGTANGLEIERQAEATLIPVGALGAEFTVHTVSIDFPFQATSVAVGGLLRGRARLYARGIGSVVGRWLVDGVPFESVAIDLDGPEAVVQTLGSLPTTFVGYHDVALEILEPVAIRTPAVRYGVTAGDTEGLRWLESPGAGAYLRSGSLPNLLWTPRAGADYQLRIGDTAEFHPRSPGWRPDPQTWRRLASGTHRVEVRAIIGSPDAPLFEERLEQELTLLNEPVALRTTCDGDDCSWAGGPGRCLYAVEWRDDAGEIVYRRITAGTQLDVERLAALLGDTTPLSWSVEARNDHGEVVGRSPTSDWPGRSR